MSRDGGHRKTEKNGADVIGRDVYLVIIHARVLNQQARLSLHNSHNIQAIAPS